MNHSTTYFMPSTPLVIGYDEACAIIDHIKRLPLDTNKNLRVYAAGHYKKDAMWDRLVAEVLYIIQDASTQNAFARFNIIELCGDTSELREIVWRRS